MVGGPSSSGELSSTLGMKDVQQELEQVQLPGLGAVELRLKGKLSKATVCLRLLEGSGPTHHAQGWSQHAQHFADMSARV
jgi:hypothetical protein